MGKKRIIKRPRRKKKQYSFLIGLLKKLAVSVGTTLIVAVGLYIAYEYLTVNHQIDPSKSLESTIQVAGEKNVASKKDNPKATQTNNKQQKTTQKTTQTAQKESKTKPFHLPANAEIPKLTVKREEQIIKHEGYTVSYNSDYRIANWVAYCLTEEEANSRKSERTNKFVPDPEVKGASAMNEDYTRTGYDRGHLAPAGDMKWSDKAMRESFYLSNICPQKPGLNRGIWKDLEEQARLWAKDCGQLMIITGPVITENLQRLGKNRVAIPKQFYKVLCYHDGKQYQGIGFLFENRDYNNVSLESMAIPIDSVEKVTGIDFFYTIPIKTTATMEAHIDLSSWSFSLF